MLTPGTIINNRYVIQANIGQGGAGTVYRALDQRSGTTVALKHVSAAPGDGAQLAHEARLLAGLSHPALPKVTDCFAEPAGQFLAMDYVPGQDLGRLPARPPLAVALGWSGQLIAVAEYLHSRRPPLVHRDIKPDNLKIGPGGQLMLLDFGLAKASAAPQPSMNRSVAGYTPQYAPLEQIQGQGTSYRSDYYALAATIYQLLTGTPPADALTRAAAAIRRQPDPLIRPAGLNPALGADLDQTLCAYLDLNIDSRPASLAPLAGAIARQAAPERAAASSAGQATIHIGANPPATNPIRRATPPASSAARWALILALVVLALLIPLKAFTTDGSPTPVAGITPKAATPAVRKRPTPTRTPTPTPTPPAQVTVAPGAITIDNVTGLKPRIKIPLGLAGALAANGAGELAVASEATITLIQQTVSLQGHKAPVTALAWAGDERLFSGDADGTVGVWEPGASAEGRFTALGRGPVKAVSWAGGRRLLAAAGHDLVALDLDTGAQQLLYTHRQTITALAAKPDGSLLALGDAEGAVLLMDPAGKLIVSLDAHAGTVMTIAWNPGGQPEFRDLLATGALDGAARIWRATSAGATPLHTLRAESPILGLDWSPHDGGQFLLAGTGAHVQLWHQPYLAGVTTRVGPFVAKTAEQEAAMGSTSAVAWLAGGGHIASIDRNGLLWIWNP